MAARIPAIIVRLSRITDLTSIEGEIDLYVSPGSAENMGKAILLLGENTALIVIIGSATR